MTLLPKARTDSFFSDSVFIFLTRFFPVLAAFSVQIYYSRILDESIYGSYQNFWVQVFIFAAVACVGIPVFVITYPPHFLVRLLYKIGLRRYIYIFSWILAISVCFTLMQSGKGFGMVIPFLFFLVHVSNSISEAFLIAFRRFRALAVINLIYGSLFFCIHYQVATEGFSVDRLFFYILLLMIGKAVLYKGIALRYFQANKRDAFRKEEMVSGVRSLWFHLGLYDLLQILARWIDKFVIGLLFTEAISGIYFNGSVDIPFLPIILGAAGSAALIHLAANTGKAEPAHTLALAHRSSRFLSAIVFPLFFFFVLYRYEIFHVFFTGKFDSAVPIFLASCMAIPTRAYSFTTILQNRNRGTLINIGAIVDLVVALLLLYPLYRLLGLAGIALSFSIATYLQAGFYLYHTGKILGVKVSELIPYRNWLLKLGIYAPLSIAAYYASVPFFSEIIILASGLVFTAIIVLISLRLEFKHQ